MTNLLSSKLEKEFKNKIQFNEPFELVKKGGKGKLENII